MTDRGPHAFFSRNQADGLRRIDAIADGRLATSRNYSGSRVEIQNAKLITAQHFDGPSSVLRFEPRLGALFVPRELPTFIKDSAIVDECREYD